MLNLTSTELKFITSMLSTIRQRLIKEHLWTPEDQVKNKTILSQLYKELEIKQ